MPSSGCYELVISRDVWERIMPSLVDGQNEVAVGMLRRNACGERIELLVDDLQPSAPVPQGERFPPLADWGAIVRPQPGRADSVADWAVRLRPRAAQLSAIVLLGADKDPGAWDGLVVQGNRTQPLAALRVVGSGMLRADRQPPQPDADLTPAALTRWSRTRGALGDAVWQRVRRSHVALFGASRTGSIAAFQFAALGVGRLLLCDPDTLEIHNLDAMQGVSEEDVGRTKVEALAERLVGFRSDLFVQGLACCATDARVVERVRCADLIVTCADSDTPRLAAAMLASRLLKVHLDVGTGVTSDESGERQIAADVRLFVPGPGCVACVGGLPDEEHARYEVLAPPGALRRARSRPWHQQRAGSLITINAMAVSVAVQLWLDLLGGHLPGSHWSRLRWHPGRGLEIHAGTVTASPDCKVCQRVPSNENSGQ
jgi:molybdopterin/thiamine biosynthesis adenylyltransferase